MAIHGISPEDVEDAPSFMDLLPAIASIIRGKTLVIYNADFNTGFLPVSLLREPQQIFCCMKRFARERVSPEWNEKVSLKRAFEEIGCYDPRWEAHCALGDARAVRTVWRWLEMRARTAQEVS